MSSRVLATNQRSRCRVGLPVVRVASERGWTPLARDVRRLNAPPCPLAGTELDPAGVGCEF